MKFLLTINSLEQLNSKADGYLIGNDKYGVRLTKSFDVKNFNQDCFIMVNKLFHNHELDDLEKYLKSLKQAKGIIFSDLAVYNICERLGMTDKLVYDPQTLITNKMELKFWEDRIFGVVISPFISYEELKEFKSSKLSLFYLGNGRIPLFYSKRPLITNYAKYHDIKDDFKTHKLVIKEELRDGFYPIVEDKNGCFVYSPFIFSCLDEASQLEGIIDYLIIDLVYDNEFIKGDSQGFLDRKIVYRKDKEND